ncbi:MAG: protoporphyrinogen oxidase [Caldilineaceae bacterium]
MSDPQVDIAIVGGGITGLSTAWYIQQEAQKRGQTISYTLLESADRWGGKILTQQVDGGGDSPFVVEGGPDSFITQKPWALQLARELGLAEALLPTNDHLRQTFVLNKGEPTPLPDGVMLIVPTRFAPFVTSPLLSPLGKLRMGLELFMPAKQDEQDETLADFIRRRLGSEALDKIAEPLMSGIYNAEAERQSLLATFPRFRELEKQHGSLIKGMLAARKGHVIRTNGGSPGSTSNGTAHQPSNPQGRPPLTAFVSLQRGMGQLVETLQDKLTGDCRLGVTVQRVEPTNNGGYALRLDDGPTIAARCVILVTPAHVAATLLDAYMPDAATALSQIRYVSTGTISLAFKRAEVEHPLNGFGIVIPRSEKRPINAITWSSTKFNQRAPADHVLLRVFFGGSRTPATMALDDEALTATVRQELAAIMGVTATPLFQRIYRWQEANPQYDVGHLERVAAIEAALPTNLWVTGSPYRGVGVPDCVRQAQETASKAVAAILG